MTPEERSDLKAEGESELRAYSGYPSDRMRRFAIGILELCEELEAYEREAEHLRMALRAMLDIGSEATK